MPAGELRPVVTTDRLGLATLPNDRVQHSRLRRRSFLDGVVAYPHYPETGLGPVRPPPSLVKAEYNRSRGEIGCGEEISRRSCASRQSGRLHLNPNAPISEPQMAGVLKWLLGFQVPESNQRCCCDATIAPDAMARDYSDHGCQRGTRAMRNGPTSSPELC